MSRDAATVIPVRIGISACLLGQKVRYDGGHKRDAFLVEVFARHVEWVPVCPEVEMGLGVPRDTLRLELQRDDIRLIMPKTGADYTEPMRAFAAGQRAIHRLPFPLQAFPRLVRQQPSLPELLKHLGPAHS